MAEYISKHEAYTLMKDLEAAYIYPPVKEAYGTAARRIDQMPSADVQPVVDTENMATVSDEFICKKCGIYLIDYSKVVMDEDNDGYIDELHYEYEPKFCPECGAKIKGR